MELPADKKNHLVWQLTDGTVVVQSESDIKDKLHAWAEKNQPTLLQRIRHGFFRLLEKI